MRRHLRECWRLYALIGVWMLAGCTEQEGSVSWDLGIYRCSGQLAAMDSTITVRDASRFCATYRREHE